MTIAVFPGSFDPITTGHESIVRRALPLFDKIIIAVGVNSIKKNYFPATKRYGWLKKIFEKEKKVEVKTYRGLTVEFCRTAGAKYILRGLRTSADFEFERTIAQFNRAMAGGIETIFILSEPQYSHITSGIVRDIIQNGGSASEFVPAAIRNDF